MLDDSGSVDDILFPSDNPTEGVLLDDNFVASVTNNEISTRTSSRFQPKAKPKPKSKKIVTFPDAVTGVTKSIGAAPDAGSSEFSTMQDTPHVMEEPVLHAQTLQDGAHVSQGGTSLQADSGMPIAEPTTTTDGIDIFHDTPLQPSATSDHSVGKLQPKHNIKRKDTHPEISGTSHVTEDVTPSHWDSPLMDNKTQEDHDPCFAGDTTMWTSDSILTNLGRQTPVEDNVEEQTQQIMDKNVMASVENGTASRLSMELRKRKDASTPGKQDVGAVDDWDADDDWDVGEQNQQIMDENVTASVENCTASRLSMELRKRKDASTPGKQDVGAVDDWDADDDWDVGEQTQQIMDENVTASVENCTASRLSMELRKRKDASTPGKQDVRATDDWDAGADDDWDVEDPDSAQMDRDLNSDEYRDEDMPKQKKASRKSKRQKTENQKTVRRRKKTPEETDSTKQELPKKKFPHGTRRRRQVDKALLEMPEDEIDPMQIKIKDLIMLAEAKERISSKEPATLGTNERNDDPFFNDTYDEEPDDNDDLESHLTSLRSSTKLNYHTYANRPKSGRWSKLETEEFYKAIRQFGTNFEMIQQLFPNRTRHQVKLKYKNEERKNPLLLGDAIQKRSSDDNSCYTRLIQQLQTQAEENARQEEAMMAEAEKEIQDGIEGEEGNTSKCDDWDDNENATNYNGNEDFNWDVDASSEKYSTHEANDYEKGYNGFEGQADDNAYNDNWDEDQNAANNDGWDGDDQNAEYGDGDDWDGF